ncbi:MAG: S1C family serine protease [Actinomycetota bacterium]
MSVLEDLGRSLSELAEKVGPAVVGVGNRWAVGSGVLIGDGRVLTNAHNLSGDGVTVTFSDGETVEAHVKGSDVDTDLAVLSAGNGRATAIEWIPAEVSPTPGTPVVGVANPGGRGLRVTFGFVSGVDRSFRGPRGRRIGGGFEHTAPLLPGSSGGPVVDPAGRLLGINTHRLGGGFYLAIPADAALRERVEALSAGKAPRTHRLGVGLAPPEVAAKLRKAVGLSPREGLLVRWVEEGSAAGRAGVREGDLIVAVAGEAVDDADTLHRILSGAGDSLVLGLVRGTEELDVTVAFE